MKPSNITFAGFALFLVASGFGAYFYSKSNDLENEISALSNIEQPEIDEKSDSDQLNAIDEILVSGEYERALEILNAKLKGLPASEKQTILNKIELTEKLVQITELESRIVAQNKSVVKADTVSIKPKTMKIREYDSLTFALQKSNMKVKALQRQLTQKSFGQYISFRNSKGSEVYYVGQVRNGKANGMGVALLSTGSRYEGGWQNNMRHGDGKFYWTDGQRYEGSYAKDKREGEGTYYWPNGDRYEGQWKDDHRNGNGTFYDKDGKMVASGLWKNDKLTETTKK